MGVAVHGMSYLSAFNVAEPSSWLMASAAIVLSTALLLGTLTPIAGSMAIVGQLVFGIALLLKSGPHADDVTFTAINSIVISVAVTLLGPGAFSLDARWFGRREIIIPESHRSRLP